MPGVGWLPAAVQWYRDVRGVGGWQSQYPEPTQVETTVVAETTDREGYGVLLHQAATPYDGDEEGWCSFGVWERG